MLTMRSLWPMVVDGKELSTERTLLVFDKYTREPIGTVASGDESHVEMAVECALHALPRIKELSLEERLAVVERWAHFAKARQRDFVELTVGELGRPVKVVDRFFDLGLNIALQYRDYINACYGSIAGLFAAREAPLPGKRAYYRWEPKGVMGLCLPANDSLNLFWEKVVPMFLAGNAIVVKASASTPLAVLLAALLAREAGFPDGALNVIVGPSERLAQALVAHPRCDYVQFIGRSDHGVELSKLAAEFHKEFDGEYEGNDWAFVLSDADIDGAAKAIVAGLTVNSGQVCMHVQGVLAEAEVYDALVERVVSLVKQMKVGDPRDPQTDVGPLISAGQAERALQQIRDAMAGGANLVAGGGCAGTCFEPAVIVDVLPTMRLVREETFAPVLWVRSVAGVDEMLQWASLNQHRLTATIFSRDIKQAEQLAARLAFSRVVINDNPTAINHPYHPWGGLGVSGKGGMLPWFERYTYKKFVETPA